MFLCEVEEAADVEDELAPDDAADEVVDEELELPQAASAKADAMAMATGSPLRLIAGLVTDFNCTALSFD